MFWNSPNSEALYQIMDTSTMKYRGWPKLVHLLADYARDSGTTTLCPCGFNWQYIPCNRAICSPIRTVYRRQVKKLHAFMMRHLRSIKRITWMKKVTNKDILERTGLPSMEDLLIRKNLRWTGHLMRMTPGRIPNVQSRFSTLN